MSEFARQRAVAKQANVRPDPTHCQGDGSFFAGITMPKSLDGGAPGGLAQPRKPRLTG